MVSFVATKEDTIRRLNFALGCIRHHLPVRMACVATHAAPDGVEIITAQGMDGLDEAGWQSVRTWVQSVLSRHTSPQIITTPPFSPEPSSALVYPFTTPDNLPAGVVVVAEGENAHSPASVSMLTPIVEVIQTVLENYYLMQRNNETEQFGRAALLDSVTDGVLMIMPDEHASVLTVNQQFRRMFDLDPNKSCRVPLQDLLVRMRVPQKIRQQLAAVWLSLDAASTEHCDGEFTMRGVNGLHTEIHWDSAPVYQDGHVFGRIFTFHDVTADRAAERLRDDLLQRVSHELRTPLTSIYGFAQMVMDDATLPESAQEYVSLIRNSADHLRLIVSDIVEITRANTGKMSLQRTPTDMNHIVKEVVARLDDQSRAKHQRVLLELDEVMLPRVNVDVDRMMRAFRHLVANAIKYGPDGCDIHVRTQYVAGVDELPSSAPHDAIAPCVLVSIVDGGPGLTREELPYIFEPLYRTKHAQTQQIEGAGMGLAIARSLIDLHRGTIWAQAATKREPGGRFYVTLPACHS